MINFILYIFTTLSISKGEQKVFIPIEKYGKKILANFDSQVRFTLDISDIEEKKKIYLTYKSPNSMNDLSITYYWSKDNYYNILSDNIIKNTFPSSCPEKREKTVQGKITVYKYCNIDKNNDSYNTLVIDLSKQSSESYYEYLEVEHTDGNPLYADIFTVTGLFIILIVVIIVIAIIICIAICCCKGINDCNITIGDCNLTKCC